ncbi:MAG: MBOAT family protein [Leptospirales bacterium]|nr:MBOAT family protein [Leptospirales bacterium]
MLFNSLHFFVFAPVVAVVYFQLPLRWQKLWLLVASFYFYAAFNPPFTLLLLFSVVVTFAFVWLMERSSTERGRKVLLTGAILSNLLLLFVFKFLDFTLDSYNRLLGLKPGDAHHVAAAGLILPLGISFFTLQAIGYAVDIYRRDIPTDGGIARFALFESFYPQLVAGPIMRARDLLHQFEEQHRFRFGDLRAGLGLMVLGFFKKTIVADPCGRIVDQIYGLPDSYSSGAMWLAACLHALQIYGDFSGYTDIAIGAGRAMGFRIPDNFRRPFLSGSMTEFWGRWHISLSTWLRDYIYIPLGGNRVGALRTYFNLFVTMFISGVWHGAGLNYILWGLGHAALMLVERFIGGSHLWRERLAWLAVRPLRLAYSFLSFSLLLFFFRARPLPDQGLQTAAETGWHMLERALVWSAGAKSIVVPEYVLAAIAVLLFGEYLHERRPNLLPAIFKRDLIFWPLCLSVLGYCILVYAASDSAPFVYFQF